MTSSRPRAGSIARRFAPLAPVLALVAACHTTPGAKVQERMTAMKLEQTQEKLLDRGKAFASIGDMTRAEEYLAAAISQGKNERAIEPLLLSVCVTSGRYRVAIEYAEQYLKKFPNDAQVRLVLATLYAGIGDTPSAKTNLETVIEARPEDPEPHFALGVLLRDNDHDPVGADTQFREYLRLAPKGDHVEEAQASLLKSVP